MAELGALPEPREARALAERLASEMAGLERSVQYKTADLASAPCAFFMVADQWSGDASLPDSGELRRKAYACINGEESTCSVMSQVISNPET